MFSISTIIPTEINNVIIHEDLKSKLADNTSRSTMVPTLDGGTVLISSGVSESDRVMSLVARVTQDQSKKLWWIFNNQNLVLISCSEGVFLAHIKSIHTNSGELKMSIYIKGKEN